MFFFVRYSVKLGRLKLTVFTFYLGIKTWNTMVVKIETREFWLWQNLQFQWNHNGFQVFTPKTRETSNFNWPSFTERLKKIWAVPLLNLIKNHLEPLKSLRARQKTHNVEFDVKTSPLYFFLAANQGGYLKYQSKIVCSRGVLRNGKIDVRKSALNQGEGYLRGGGYLRSKLTVCIQRSKHSTCSKDVFCQRWKKWIEIQGSQNLWR